MKRKTPIVQLENLYSTWLKRIKNHFRNTAYACRFVYDSLPRDVDRLKISKSIFNKSRLSANIQRAFSLKLHNLFSREDSRSVLGLIEGDLKVLPEEKLEEGFEYVSNKGTYKFNKAIKEGEGTFYYVAFKAVSTKRIKGYIISNVYEDYYNRGDEILSVWVNNKLAINRVSYSEKKDHIIYKKITLREGENIILLKLENIKKWKNIRYRLSDSKGYQLDGVNIQKFAK